MWQNLPRQTNKVKHKPQRGDFCCGNVAIIRSESNCLNLLVCGFYTIFSKSEAFSYFDGKNKSERFAKNGQFLCPDWLGRQKKKSKRCARNITAIKYCVWYEQKLMQEREISHK